MAMTKLMTSLAVQDMLALATSQLEAWGKGGGKQLKSFFSRLRNGVRADATKEPLATIGPCINSDPHPRDPEKTPPRKKLYTKSLSAGCG